MIIQVGFRAKWSVFLSNTFYLYVRNVIKSSKNSVRKISVNMQIKSDAEPIINTVDENK